MEFEYNTHFTLWANFKIWLNIYYEMGIDFSRKDIKGFFRFVNKIENYRTCLTKLGYLERVGEGKYKVLKPIPMKMLTPELFKLAYPKTEKNVHT